MKKRVLVRGPVLSRSGYGEHARFVIRSLKRREDIELFIVPVGWGKTGWLYEDDAERNWIDQIVAKTAVHIQKKGTFDVAIQVTIPGEWEKLAPINIGVTAGMETLSISKQWVEKTHLVEKIVVPSEHSKYGFDKTAYNINGYELKCETPVEVVQYPVRIFEQDEGAIKAQLDELPNDFNFLTVAQWGPRKNLEETIVAFVEAMHTMEVGLVVKASIASDCKMDRGHAEDRLQKLIANAYKKFPEHKCSVHLLHGHLSETEMSTLYQHDKIKTIISASHGEGYGLPLFEAAYYGLPMVTPVWGGVTEFTHALARDKKQHKTVLKSMVTEVDYTIQKVDRRAVWKDVIEPDMLWCYPDMGSFKRALSEAHRSPGEKKGIAKKLMKRLREDYKEETMYDRMNEVLFGFEKEAVVGVV